MTHLARRPGTRCFCLPLLLVMFVADSATGADDHSGIVTVSLKPVAGVNSRVVLIGDVGEVQSGDPSLAGKIAKIDISDPPVEGQPTFLSKSQVKYRLMLAGYARNQFEVVGADLTQVHFDSAPPIDDAAVISVVRDGLARGSGIAPDDINLALRSPLSLRADYVHVNPNDIRLEVRLPTSLKSNVLNTRIAIHVGQRFYELTSVSFDLTINTNLPKARRNIRAGETFSEANLVYEATPIDADALARVATDPIGKRARQDLPTGQIVEKQHIMSTAQIDNEILVRPRDMVHVVARRGGIYIRMKDAHALEMGRRGDSVRVRNPQTNTILQGQVTDKRVVEVPF